jgi:hypothetical protein
MKRTAIFILICLAFSVTSCKYVRKKGWFGTKKADTMEVWQARQNSIRVADSLAKVQERLMAIERARADSLNRVEQARLEYEARFRYHIVVGSFITPEYASAYLDYFRKQGYSAKSLRMPGSRFEVISAEAHDNLNTAIRRLKQYRDTVAVDTWIYIAR